jgi:hypothetical protein
MFAKVVFRAAGGVGLLSLPGMYLLPGPPLYYAALAGLAAWQPAFFVIAGDPAKFRSLMMPAVLEKVIWVATLVLLYGRGSATTFELAVFVPTSAVFAGLFIAARKRTPA